MSNDKPTVSAGVCSLLQQLESYCEKMAPGKRLTEDQINTSQKGLYLNLRAAFRQADDADFRAVFNGIVDLFAAHRDGALSTLLVSRNHYSVKLDAEQRKEFSRMVGMFVVLASPLLRAGFNKRVDPVKALKGLDEPYFTRALNHVNNLVKYYQQEAA